VLPMAAFGSMCILPVMNILTPSLRFADFTAPPST
jgi:hypothetical protein